MLHIDKFQTLLWNDDQINDNKPLLQQIRSLLTVISKSRPGFSGWGAAVTMGRGSAGASIWLSWKSPWPVICTSLLTCRGEPRTYPDTQRVPNPVAGPPVPFWLELGIYVALWASRCERRERKPNRLCFCADRCLTNRVASCSLSTGKRRASEKWDSTNRDSALRDSVRFFTARSVTPWHTSAAGQRGRRFDSDWSIVTVY